MVTLRECSGRWADRRVSTISHPVPAIHVIVKTEIVTVGKTVEGVENAAEAVSSRLSVGTRLIVDVVDLIVFLVLIVVVHVY